MKMHFEPNHQTEILKQRDETLHDFSNDLQKLINKVMPDVQEEAWQQCIIWNNYLTQVAFSVRQKCYKTLAEAIALIIEIELLAVASAMSSCKGEAKVIGSLYSDRELD